MNITVFNGTTMLFGVDLPLNQYLSIGYGEYMANTDMVLF